MSHLVKTHESCGFKILYSGWGKKNWSRYFLLFLIPVYLLGKGKKWIKLRQPAGKLASEKAPSFMAKTEYEGRNSEGCDFHD